MEHYATSLQHILAELERIDLLIQVQVERARQVQASDAEFQGLYIPEQEVDALLAQPIGIPRWATVLPSFSLEVRTALDRLAEESARCKKKSAMQGITLRLEELARLFQLNQFDIDVLLICLAPDLDLRYERLYAYLQDDVTKKRPSVDLVLNLLCSSFEEKLRARPRFESDASLLRHHLLHLFDDPSYQNPPLLGRYLKVDERVVSYLLDSDEIDTRLLPYARHIMPQARFEDILLPSDVKRRLMSLTLARQSVDDGLIFYFQGSYGVGKQVTAEAICRDLGMRLLAVDGERLLNAEGSGFDKMVHLAGREALLQGAALYWDGFDALLADDRRASLDMLLHELEGRRELTFLAGDTTWEPMDALHTKAFVRIELPRPSSAERVQLWARSLDGDTSLASGVDLSSVANKFRFSGGQIKDAAVTARNLARWRDPENGHVTLDDLYSACRLQSNRKLATLAQKITPHYKWDDIVLPSDRLEQLKEICNYVKYRSLVYDEWGFDLKLSMGKGLNALFAGPSGTGKTMAADIMAGELSLDLYKIDLSSVVSKYIGETEKNLARIFAEAETSNAILFFDEADALFGRRSEVRDSHDRYANIEISYLLQKMEEYKGVVILATNLRKNMDDAFVRRMHFTIEFPFPTENDRRRIWERIWPDDMPRSPDLDLDFMASRFEVAGGNIRNIALAAAFLAADDGGAVNMVHLTRATQREYQKMGKVVMEMEFGKYAEHVVAGM
ncbi:MAG TPA: ATP-binding protein [Chloroflexi bacterium]|nr:ATP-binding protein [Chloroflexota bacterium]